jgi:hypothetical protein
MSKYIFIADYDAEPLQGSPSSITVKKFKKGNLVEGKVWDRRSAGGDSMLVVDNGFYNILIDSIKNGNKNSPIREYSGNAEPKPIAEDKKQLATDSNTTVNPPVVKIGNFFTRMSTTSKVVTVVIVGVVAYYGWKYYKK